MKTTLSYHLFDQYGGLDNGRVHEQELTDEAVPLPVPGDLVWFNGVDEKTAPINTGPYRVVTRGLSYFGTSAQPQLHVSVGLESVRPEDACRHFVKV